MVIGPSSVGFTHLSRFPGETRQELRKGHLFGSDVLCLKMQSRGDIFSWFVAEGGWTRVAVFLFGWLIKGPPPNNQANDESRHKEPGILFYQIQH